jgi:hypothetical protein
MTYFHLFGVITDERLFKIENAGIWSIDRWFEAP